MCNRLLKVLRYLTMQLTTQFDLVGIQCLKFILPFPFQNLFSVYQNSYLNVASSRVDIQWATQVESNNTDSEGKKSLMAHFRILKGNCPDTKNSSRYLACQNEKMKNRKQMCMTVWRVISPCGWCLCKKGPQTQN